MSANFIDPAPDPVRRVAAYIASLRTALGTPMRMPPSRTFTRLRQGNLRLLERASPADRERVGVHVERGEESIVQMIPNYAGHDMVHLR